jgi:hypothetical protein
MELHEIEELLALLPRGQTIFHYYRDEYAVRLLRYATRETPRVAELRKTRWRPLLEKAGVRPLLARASRGVIEPDHLLGHWPAERWAFQLTLGQWGSSVWNRPLLQTSRPGYNLVLQLNFTAQHDEAYRALLAPTEGEHPFVYVDHPVSREHLTLAWARLDIDLAHGEVLIEELQSDWVHCARRSTERIWWTRPREGPRYFGWGRVSGATTRERARRYLEQVLWPYERWWAEALLSAALFFIVEELGIRRIFLHTDKSGELLKEPFGSAKPPRSLYTALPRRFCFQRTRQLPRLLKDCPNGYLQGKLEREQPELNLLEVA